MLDKDNRIVKVVTFFQTLPEDLLENIIGVLPVNRDIRRKISKQKSSKNKVMLLMTQHFRKIFVDAAYATIKPFISLELETAGYDEKGEITTDIDWDEYDGDWLYLSSNRVNNTGDFNWTI